MQFEERNTLKTVGTILLHNIAGADGKRVLKKGIVLTEQHIAKLTEIGHATVDVAVLSAADVHEDTAALALAEAMQTEYLSYTRARGGRVNLRTSVNGLLAVDAERLLAVNMLPGFAIATRRQYTIVGPSQDTVNVATLKIVPYAVARHDLDRALEIASVRPGIIEVRPFQQGRRVAILFVAEPAAQEKTRNQYLPPLQARLERLDAVIVAAKAVTHRLGSGTLQDESTIAQAAARLAAAADLLIIVGQTSVNHDQDTTLRALRQAGAETTLSGAPVEPGNLLALAYFSDTPTGGTPVLCAPGCAKGLKRNVVDLVLPRLLLGDQLTRRDVAALGLGGFLTAAERAGDIT